MNKLFMIMLVVLLCGVAIIFVVAASGPEWVQFNAKNKSSIFHSYLPSSLNGSGPKRIMNLWLKASYNDKLLNKVLDQNKDYIDAYSHSLLRVRVDCKRNRYVLLEEHNKSTKGYTLTSLVLPGPRQFTKIFSGTTENTWKNFACTNSGTKRIAITLKTLLKNIY